MVELSILKNAKSPCKILCLGAHSDDIEIGCGGTILRLLRRNRNLEFYWVVFSAGPRRDREARQSANLFLRRARRKTVVVKNYRTSFFPFIGIEIKEFFEELKAAISPDVIFTHYRDDLHQDHRLISDLTWNTYRNHWILEYEIPKYDGDLGAPNCFVSLDRGICERKTRYIYNSFRSQRDKHWFDREIFLSLLRLRGMESNAPGKYAEAFYSRKTILSPDA